MKRLGILSMALLLEIALFTSISGRQFHSPREFLLYQFNFLADPLLQSAPALLLAFGMTIILLSAGIDLSIGSSVALISCVMSSFPPAENFWWTALPSGLAVGIGAGFLNGLLISRFEVPPIIATLGTMIFYRGLCFVVMGDLEKAPFLEVAGYESLGHFTGAALVVGAVFLLGGTYLANSVWRRELAMIGGNRVAARFAGLKVGRRTMQAYLLMGLLAFLAAVLFTARNGSVSASSLSGLELHVIVAVVLGGTKVQGGSATLLGSLFGVLFIAILDEGLRSAALWGSRHLPFKISYLAYLLLGSLLVGGVALSNWLQRLEESGRESSK